MNGANFQSLAALTSLQWLDLSDAKIIGSDFATLPNLPKLQTLYLNGKNVTDEHLMHLAKLRLSLLATLSLTSTSVSDRGVSVIMWAIQPRAFVFVLLPKHNRTVRRRAGSDDELA